jgi:hypothetical protein
VQRPLAVYYLYPVSRKFVGSNATVYTNGHDDTMCPFFPADQRIQAKNKHHDKSKNRLNTISVQITSQI